MTGFICAVPLISALFSACLPEPPLATGYVEGEFVLVAPVATSQIEKMTLRRGDHVRQGDILVQMERRDAGIALAEAEAALKAAEARLANLQEGMRDEEIRVIEANLASAHAQANELEKEVARVQNLVTRGVSPQAQLDEVQTQLDVANAKVAEVEANLSVAKLPARAYEIAAAEAELSQAKAGVEAAAWQLDQRTLYASADGQIHEVLRNTGELAGPQAPVLSLLPDGAVFIRLYVPETAVSGIEVGTVLRVNCDGCGDGARATVTYVADEPEFTPPVIYSLENRQKLVFMVEAHPSGDTSRLKPGQIVDAVLEESGQ
ncbi:HlyD family secretion protein [Pseudoruegeria sp. HB172150]|uniref:HlyD family secretion protein n=1 Tax=Pseudoruegeria sp. HB172150 TaxID=2721164 RepID=UPI001553D76F|nr:HlyD family efflux transporter periplasmic adaptor subunit [Pseudoruegeria sp. HB172150]